MKNKSVFLEEVKTNINNYGHHISIIKNGVCPRFAYSIGAVEKIGFEVIFAGGLFYKNDEVSIIIDNIINKINHDSNWQELKIEINTLGVFVLSKAHHSWSKLLALGVYDFYKKDDIEFLQILPDKEHHTIEIPNLSQEFVSFKQPIWQWLVNEWSYPIPKDVMIVTNLDVLLGKPITEIMRWEEYEWEMFFGNGNESQEEDIRIIPIGILLGFDNTIIKALNLKIGKGLWRSEESMEWNDWG
jgi:hypothetical protein